MRTTTSSIRPRLLASTALLAALLLPVDPVSAQETTDPAADPAVEEPAEPATEEIIPLKPLTVTGTKTPARDARDVPATIDVIDQEELERKQPLTLGDILNDLPGVEMEGGVKGSESQPNIRGLGSTGWGTNRVVMSIDGARQNVGSGHGGTMFLDPEMVKNIEVMKGPGSTLYGSGAIGGVISVETKDAADFIDQGNTFGFRAKAGFHSVNDEPLLSGIFAVKPIEQMDFLGSIVWRDSQDWKGGSGLTIDNTEVDILSGLVKMGIDPAEGHRIELSGLLYDNNEDILATDVDNLNAEYDADHKISKSTATLNYSFDSPDTDLVNLMATIYRDDNDVEDEGEDYDRTVTTELTTTGLDVHNTFEFDSSWADHAVTFGTEFYHDDGKGRLNGEAREQFSDATQDVVGVYLQYELKLFDQLSIVPGVRWDYYENHPEGDFSDQSNDRISPKIGVNWRPIDWLGLYGSYGEAYRAPSVSELYIGGTHFSYGAPGWNNTFIPNPDLKPETVKTWEGGVRLDFDDVVLDDDDISFNAAYYTTRAKNFVDAEVTTTFIPPFGPLVGTTTPINVPRAEIDGFEISLGYDSDYFFFNGGYSRVRGENKTDDTDLTSIPADKLLLTLGARIPPLDIAFGVTNEYLWGQNHTTEDLKTDSVNLVGLFATWEPSEGALEGFRLDAGIENITDEEYVRYLATEEGPGRDYRVAVSYGMSF